MKRIWKWWLAVIVIMIAWETWVRPTDPTDGGTWYQRSNLYHYKDYGTGCEYISAGGGIFGKGALSKRIDKNGNHICN